LNNSISCNGDIPDKFCKDTDNIFLEIGWYSNNKYSIKYFFILLKKKENKYGQISPISNVSI
jgi:hypothetical protein